MTDKTLQPLISRIPIVKQDGTPTDYFIKWAQIRQEGIADSVTIEQVEEAIDAWAAGRTISAGTGLIGGGNLSADISIELADTAVAPGTYGDATHVARITVDQQGRITAVSLVAITGGGSGGIYMPLVDGNIPPAFIQASDGSLIYAQVA